MGLYRLAHLMSLMVMIKAMASASCPRRALVLRSVLRRSWPKFDSHELVRSMVQRIPSGSARGWPRAVPRRRLGVRTMSSMPKLSQTRRTGSPA